MLKRIILGTVLSIYCALLPAQEVSDTDRDRQYVTDELRLSMYANANDNSQVLKLLESGDSVDIEQIQGPYALVLGPDGTRGWVKRGFLVTEPTSNLLLAEERRKTESLAAEIEKLANSKAIIEQYEQDMDEMAEKLAALEAEKRQVEQAVAALEQQVEDKQRELDARYEDGIPALFALWDTLKNYWPYIAPVVLLIVLLSYLVSKAIIEARIKARFQGIKIW
jgi:SH3 domain protein